MVVVTPEWRCNCRNAGRAMRERRRHERGPRSPNRQHDLSASAGRALACHVRTMGVRNGIPRQTGDGCAAEVPATRPDQDQLPDAQVCCTGNACSRSAISLTEQRQSHCAAARSRCAQRHRSSRYAGYPEIRYACYHSPMRILLVGRTQSVIDDVIKELGAGEVEFSTANSLEGVQSALAKAQLDHVIIGGGLDLDSRLQIVRRVFESSSSTTGPHELAVRTGELPAVRQVRPARARRRLTQNAFASRAGEPGEAELKPASGRACGKHSPRDGILDWHPSHDQRVARPPTPRLG